ncbi:hypothetical protein V8F33_008414 [Rhypophila sp. PSN 637]
MPLAFGDNGAAEPTPSNWWQEHDVAPNRSGNQRTGIFVSCLTSTVMQIRCLFLLAVVPGVCSADGPVDWTKAPGGGPSTLRGCAQYADNPCSRAGSVYDLGCSTNSIDLINKAYASIESVVKANCGADAIADIEQAKKIYNDYCSANGFPIPGYTYIITQTVRVSTGKATAAAATPTVKGPGLAAGGDKPWWWANGYRHHGADGDGYSLCGCFRDKGILGGVFPIVVLAAFRIILTY